MALPSASSAGLDLDFSRLSLASPYSHLPPPHHPHPQHSHPHSQEYALHSSQNGLGAHHHSASSSLDRSGGYAQSGARSLEDGLRQLAPHQIMQPPVHTGPPPHVQLQEPQRRRGVVKFFNSLKGFGFVVDNDPAALGGQEVFCHFSAISGKGGFRSLAEGEEVEYELVQGPKGFQAANLTGPGGRTVVGDPKARMQKPPAYLPFAPMALPIGGPYLADPYSQHGAVYAGSPYTSHVLYVPATASLPPSQYAHAPIPLSSAAPPPPSSRGGPASIAAGASPASLAQSHQQQQGGSTFAAPQYQSYAAPPASSAGTALSGLNGAGAGGTDRYASLTRMGSAFASTAPHGAVAGAVGGREDSGRTASNPANGPGGLGSPFAGNGAGGHNGPNPAFSPPGGHGTFSALPGSPISNGMPAFGGFAPFSPPSFNHAPLFSAPPPAQVPAQQQQQYAYGAPPPALPLHLQHQQQQQQYPLHSQQQPPQQSQQQQSQHSSPPDAHVRTSSAANTPSSALFGTLPAPIGSRSGTPAGGVVTPALGNGSLGDGGAWRNTGSPVGSAVL